jgi:hypothetical protein
MTIVEVTPDTSRSFSFDAVLVTQDLFKRIRDYTVSKDLITSFYDHHRGVRRDYTLKYCLQENYHQTPKKFYVKRYGRPPPEYWWSGRVPADGKLISLGSPAERAKVLAELDARTPGFEALYKNMMHKCPGDVLRTYK